jgi:hypothetical protein
MNHTPSNKCEDQNAIIKAWKPARFLEVKLFAHILTTGEFDQTITIPGNCISKNLRIGFNF